jgi:hypothetical protein
MSEKNPMQEYREFLKYLEWRLEGLAKEAPGLAPYFESVKKVLHLIFRVPPEENLRIASEVLEFIKGIENRKRNVPRKGKKSMAWEILKRKSFQPWAERWRMKLFGKKDPVSGIEWYTLFRDKYKSDEGDFVMVIFPPSQVEGQMVPPFFDTFETPSNSLLAQCNRACRVLEPLIPRWITLSYVVSGLELEIPPARLEPAFAPLFAPKAEGEENHLLIVEGDTTLESDYIEVDQLWYAVACFLEPPTYREILEIFREAQKQLKDSRYRRYPERDAELFAFLAERSFPGKGKMKFWEECLREWNRNHKKRFSSPQAMRMAWVRLKKRLVKDGVIKDGTPGKP